MMPLRVVALRVGPLTDPDLCFLAALVFNGNINPAHPNTIGCIDSVCDVTEVARGETKAEEEE